MMRNQTGFTMIEMLAVMIILGILAVVVLPKFADLRGDAYLSAVSGMAGAFGTAASVNDSSCTATNHVVTVGAAIKVSKCSDLSPLIKPPVTLTTASGAGCNTANSYCLAADNAVPTNGSQQSCTLRYMPGAVGTTAYSATYVVIGACN